MSSGRDPVEKGRNGGYNYHKLDYFFIKHDVGVKRSFGPGIITYNMDQMKGTRREVTGYACDRSEM